MPRTQKERNEETRRALMEAGSELLREVGYARTSVAQITQRAHRAHGTFYLHFKNKRDLVRVLLDEMAAEGLEGARQITRTAAGVDAIWLTLRTFLSRFKPEERSLWLLIEEVVALEEDAALLRSTLRNNYVAPVLRGIRRRFEARGENPKNLDLLADLLTSMGLHFARTGNLPASPDVLALHMTFIWCRALGEPITVDDLEKIRRMFIDKPTPRRKPAKAQAK